VARSVRSGRLFLTFPPSLDTGHNSTSPPALGMTYNDKMRGLGRVGQALRYALNRTERSAATPTSCAPVANWRRP
jgi:hypothetical protein